MRMKAVPLIADRVGLFVSRSVLVPFESLRRCSASPVLQAVLTSSVARSVPLVYVLATGLGYLLAAHAERVTFLQSQT
jgi:hypothetical protein